MSLDLQQRGAQRRGGGGGSSASFGARLCRLARDHRSLLRRISRAEELADGIALELEELIRLLERAPGGSSPPSVGRKADDPGLLLRRAAESGAGALAQRRLADGSWLVRVDAGKEFALPPMLGELLATLAWDSGLSSDGLVGWKTVGELGELVAKRTGQALTRHAVTQNVYRLRRALFERGNVNPHLVQTHHRYGLRFALRRGEAGGAAPEAGR